MVVERIRGRVSLERADLGQASFFDPNTETLTAAKTLAVTDKRVQVLDPGGASRNVDLPAEASSAGLFFLVVNSADADGEDLTVRDDTPTTIRIVRRGARALLVCDGTTWFDLTGIADRDAAVASLTDSSGGTASDTLAAITGGGTTCENAAKNAIASLAAKVNGILTVLRNHGLIAP